MNHRLEMLGTAAAGIAHDINNQLTLILNYIETTDLEGARKAASRCTALTAGLLSYSRGEPLILEGLDIAKFLSDFTAHLRLPAGVQLTIDLKPQLPKIQANPTALHRVLTNLVSNACDAMNGPGALSITASPQTIEVSDTGPGIAPADRKRIFDPFVSTKGSKGTGLGLSIVRAIMQQHGGSVVLDSTPGQGAKFTLRFRP
ncbi:MAG: HAMP domain-containing sensor histidine kinase [Bryobacteraceae bacterium]|jgi:signal transduction histidine kinase